MLIIYKISFSPKDQIDKMKARLNLVQRKISGGNEVLSPNMIFGGYLIIFCGDFHQLPPFKVKENQSMYTNSGIWENSINVAIFLNNSHRFKDNPEFGEILKRMWDGSLLQRKIAMRLREKCN